MNGGSAPVTYVTAPEKLVQLCPPPWAPWFYSYRSRHALNADTIREMHLAFRRGGRAAINKVMKQRPAVFLKLLVYVRASATGTNSLRYRRIVMEGRVAQAQYEMVRWSPCRPSAYLLMSAIGRGLYRPLPVFWIVTKSRDDGLTKPPNGRIGCRTTLSERPADRMGSRVAVGERPSSATSRRSGLPIDGVIGRQLVDS